MPKDTKSSGNNKAPACESRGFGHKKEGENFDTPSSRVIYRLVVNTNCFTMTYACITSNGVSVWNSILRAIEGLNIRARIFRR